MSCANGCDIVVLRFSNHGTKEMLARKSDQFQTSRNNTQQQATGCVNGRNRLGVVARQCCVRLHGP